MIYRDNELSKEIHIPIYRYKNGEGVEEISHNLFETVNIHEDNEFMVCKQKDTYYIMGATPNSSYRGYVLDKEDIENKELMNGNIDVMKEIFEKYDYRALG